MHEDEHSLGSSISGHYLGEESILPSPTHKHTQEKPQHMIFLKKSEYPWNGNAVQKNHAKGELILTSPTQTTD